MTERSHVAEGLQIGVESTPGTEVDADVKIRHFDMTPTLQTDVEQHRPAGVKFATSAIPGKEWVDWAIEGVCDYTDMSYLWASLLDDPTSAQVAATSAYTHTYDPDPEALDAPLTFTIEKGQAARAGLGTFGMVTELSMEFSRSQARLRGRAVTQRYTDGITMTASPGDLTEQPILPGEIDIYSDTTSGGLGTTQFTRVINAQLTIGSRFMPVWALDSSEASFADRVEGVPTGTMSLTLAADAQGMALLDSYRNRTRGFWRLQASGPTDSIESGQDHGMTLDMAMDVLRLQELGEADGLTVARVELGLAVDTTWGKYLQLVLTNDLTDIA